MSGGAGLSTRVLPHVDFLDRYIKEQDSDQLLKILIFQIKFSLSLQLTILRHMHIFFAHPAPLLNEGILLYLKSKARSRRFFMTYFFQITLLYLEALWMLLLWKFWQHYWRKKEATGTRPYFIIVLDFASLFIEFEVQAVQVLRESFTSRNCWVESSNHFE